MMQSVGDIAVYGDEGIKVLCNDDFCSQSFGQGLGMLRRTNEGDTKANGKCC